MQTIQQDRFIKEVVQGLWLDWKPSKEQLNILKNALSYLEYEPTQFALRNWYAAQSVMPKNPPLNKIILLFRRLYRQQGRKQDSEPVLLYTLIKERFYREGKNPRIYGKGFYVGGQSRVPTESEIIEEDAERKRKEANQLYGKNHIIIRNWQPSNNKVGAGTTCKELGRNEKTFE